MGAPTARGERPPAALVRRRRLEERLDAATRHRLTTLVAGPGSGKTTLLGQWARERPVAWHTLTEADRALAPLARAIVDQVRLWVPGLTPDLILAVEGAKGPDADADEASRADSLAALVCQELDDKLIGHLVLVLDDLHEISPDGAGARFIGGLCRNSPDRFHMVAASRAPMPFPIARMRLHGDVVEIDADDLSFSASETRALVLSVLGDAAEPAIAHLHQGTAGWAAAIRLAVQALGSVPPQTRTRVLELPEARRPLFEYLAEEVMSTEDHDVVGLVRAAAHLPWLSSGLVAVLGLAGDGVFDEAVRRGIYFTATNDPGRMAAAPLMREFVLERIPLASSAVEELCSRAAGWYESAGCYAEAIEVLFDGVGSAEVGRLLEDRGQIMMASGLTQDVLGAVVRLGESERTTEVRLLEAEARQVLGDWEGALASYEAVTPPEGLIPCAVAWRMGLVHHLRGDVDLALAVYERGERDGTDLANEATLLAWTASARWLRGERDTCRALAEHALELARHANEGRAMAAAHTVLAMAAALEGDRAANDAHYLRALEHAERAHDVLQTIRIRSNRGSRNLEEGAYEQALQELDIALRLADLTGFATWRALSLSNRAQALSHLGRLEEAIADLEESRAIFRRVGSRLESYPLSHLGEVYLVRGDTAMARAAFQGAVALSGDSADLQGLVPALAGLAKVTAAVDVGAARRYAGQAVANASVLGHVAALLASGWVEQVAGDADAARRWAGEAADVARIRRDQPGLAEALELAAAVEPEPGLAADQLHEAKRLWIGLGDPLRAARVDLALAGAGAVADRLAVASAAADTLGRMGALGAARDARRLIDELEADERPPVLIATLGGFGVIRDGVSVPTAEWQSRKARDVLQMLVANRGKPVHREVLIDRLWPDENPAKASNRLSVALSTIRSVVDPAKQRPADHYLVGSRDHVAVDTGHLAVDVERFLARAARGLDRVRRGDRDGGLPELRAAEADYVGDFLEEEPYEEWAVGLREECRAVYLKVASVLAEAAGASGDHDTAARHYLRMLERDAYHEPAHLGLVSAMSAAGRHGAARRLYGSYVARMAELEVEPAPFPGPGVADGAGDPAFRSP